MDNSSCLSRLVDVVFEIQYETVPQAIIQQAKLCLADFLGIFCSGSTREEAVNLYHALGGSDLQNNTENLALWLGSASRLLDLDDGHRFAMGHPGVVLNAVAVACGYQHRATGKRLLEALIRGYEVYCYQGRMINPSAYLKRGFDATCICGAAGAATVVGSLIGLERKQMKDAISLAASLCGGLNQYAIDGGSPKYLCAGWAAKLGIVSANLAKNGLEGPEFIFEGRLGYANGFSPEPNEFYLNNVHLNWEIGKVYLKKYSCVRRIHPTLDIVEKICKQERLNAKDIALVRVYGGQFLYDAAVYRPKDIVKAQTSVPYTTALLLHYGQVTAELVESSLDDSNVAELEGKIQVINDPAFAELSKKEPSLWGASRVEITTKDGRVFADGEKVAQGDPENPFSKEAICEKFCGLVSGALNGDKGKANDLWNLINEIETQNDVSVLMRSVHRFC